MKLTNPHFRIQFPREFKGTKHRALDARVFVTFPEIGEVELSNVRKTTVGGGASDAWTIELTFYASAEVEYADAEDGEG
jgi:hypothetical protein